MGTSSQVGTTGAGVLGGAPAELSVEAFGRVARLLYELCGIRLREDKMPLVSARLTKRLKALGLSSYDDYVAIVMRDKTGPEARQFVDVLTTNKTSFFREVAHFDFVRETVLPALAGRSEPIRVWSAGCSSGEEPYSLAITLCEVLSAGQLKAARILATDISTPVLEKAKAARYDAATLESMPAASLQRYFRVCDPGPPPVYEVRDPARGLVSIARLNLMDTWPMRGPFDFIFCRNVMIYFDRETQTGLARRMAQTLRPGGYLFVGHSETLTGAGAGIQYVMPAVYTRG